MKATDEIVVPEWIAQKGFGFEKSNQSRDAFSIRLWRWRDGVRAILKLWRNAVDGVKCWERFGSFITGINLLKSLMSS